MKLQEKFYKLWFICFIEFSTIVKIDKSISIDIEIENQCPFENFMYLSFL